MTTKKTRCAAATLSVLMLAWTAPTMASQAPSPASAANAFTVDLYRAVATDDREDLFMSPLSVDVALSMVSPCWEKSGRFGPRPGQVVEGATP